MVCFRYIIVSSVHKGDNRDDDDDDDADDDDDDNNNNNNNRLQQTWCKENRTAIVIETTFLLTYNLSNTGAEKITTYENLALENKIIWKLNNISI